MRRFLLLLVLLCHAALAPAAGLIASASEGRVPCEKSARKTEARTGIKTKKRAYSAPNATQGYRGKLITSIVLSGLGLFFILTFGPFFIAFAFWTGWLSLVFFLIPFGLCVAGAVLGGMALQSMSEDPEARRRGKKGALIGLILGLVGAVLIVGALLLFLTFL